MPRPPRARVPASFRLSIRLTPAEHDRLVALAGSADLASYARGRIFAPPTAVSGDVPEYIRHDPKQNPFPLSAEGHAPTAAALTKGLTP